MVDQAQQLPAGPIRFWNVKAAGRSAIVALAAAAILIPRHGLVSYLAIAFAGGVLYCAFFLLRGVALSGAEIVFPRSAFRALPFLVIGRARRAIGQLEEITYIGQSFGSEWVILRFGDEHFPAPFASRENRLAFFEAVQAKKPDIRIYRAF